MRIITGTARGVKLETLDSDATRPTSDKVKEAIFSMIQFEIEGRRVLDLFGGSGQLALEALSRGAAHAVLTDNDKRSVQLIRKNIDELRFNDICTVVEKSSYDYAKTCNKRFDIIFLDPPYNKGYIEPALEMISEYNLLSENGIVVLESDNTDFKSEVDGLLVEKQKRYGRTFITIYKNVKNGG